MRPDRRHLGRVRRSSSKAALVRALKTALFLVFFVTSAVLAQSGLSRAWTTTSPQLGLAVYKSTGRIAVDAIEVSATGQIVAAGRYSNGTAYFDPDDQARHTGGANAGRKLFVAALSEQGEYADHLI